MKGTEKTLVVLSGVLFVAGCSGSSGGGNGAVPTPKPTLTRQWAWMSGSSTIGANGVYGTLGTPASGNVPGGRASASSWTDANGNLWLFGGAGIDSSGTSGVLNDLWKFNPSTGQWAWMSGSSTIGTNQGQPEVHGQPGVYGTLAIPGTGNVPGGRISASSWTDANGNFWLFGGSGIDSTGAFGKLNDLWEFNPSTRQWAWMSGSGTIGANMGQPGVYGTLGTASAGNVPGGRYGANTWTDANGNFWVFGGVGFDSTGISSGELNDLWEFNPLTRQWAWMSGSNTLTCIVQAPYGRPLDTVCAGQGVYGTLGTPAPGNVPVGVLGPVGWIDKQGYFWIFGGLDLAAAYTGNASNYFWEFYPPTMEWGFMGGSSDGSAGTGPPGVYGTLGNPGTGNVPGGRSNASGWTDANGNLWLFGGVGIGSTGAGGELNDLWKFDPVGKTWTWESGSNNAYATGVYGTLGTAAAANVPGARYGASTWTDNMGNLWLFGGSGGAPAAAGVLNDLWKYTP